MEHGARIQAALQTACKRKMAFCINFEHNCEKILLIGRTNRD